MCLWHGAEGYNRDHETIPNGEEQEALLDHLVSLLDRGATVSLDICESHRSHVDDERFDCDALYAGLHERGMLQRLSWLEIGSYENIEDSFRPEWLVLRPL